MHMPALSVPSTITLTGTGLDRILDILAADPGLTVGMSAAGTARKQTATAKGLEAAGAMNRLISDAITATGVASDGLFSADDVLKINSWIRADAARLATFTQAHGDDEGGVETGYHLIQGNGAVIQYDGLNFANRVVDGLYHIGFEVKGTRFVNEDGNANATIAEVASWLNYAYLGKNDVVGTAGDDRYTAGQSDALFKGAEVDIYRGYAGNDVARTGAGNDILYGDEGNDALFGEAGDDRLLGGGGNDQLEGGAGSDVLDGGLGRDKYVLDADGAQDILIFRPGDTGKTFGTADIVTGFESGVDKIDLTAFGKLSFQEGAAFSGKGGEALFVANTLFIDRNGDKMADAVVAFQGLTTLSSSSFIFG
jgi:Ca2+-binding RTX toxin-like protein